MKRIIHNCVRTHLVFKVLFGLATLAHADTAKEGAAFLDIPVGARPAALGGAYSAITRDAYSMVWNPAGLAALNEPEFASMHLSYLEEISYEYVGLADGIAPGQGLGASIQYFHTGAIEGADASGNPTLQFTSNYSAYSLGYGVALSSSLAVGVSGRYITARIDGYSANAWAADVGGLYQVDRRWFFSLVGSNLGAKLKFDQQGDPLPTAVHVGAAYRPPNGLGVMLEHRQASGGRNSEHVGLEWRAPHDVSLRAGYRTDVIKGLSFPAGFTTGLGIKVFGQDLDYAYLPYGDLGQTHYFSLVLRFKDMETDIPERETKVEPRKFEYKGMNDWEVPDANPRPVGQ